jgi:hypothetical protein
VDNWNRWSKARQRARGVDSPRLGCEPRNGALSRTGWDSGSAGDRSGRSGAMTLLRWRGKRHRCERAKGRRENSVSLRWHLQPSAGALKLSHPKVTARSKGGKADAAECRVRAVLASRRIGCFTGSLGARPQYERTGGDGPPVDRLSRLGHRGVAVVRPR